MNQLQASENAGILDLGGTWRYMPDPHADGEELGWFRRKIDETAWGSTPVPSVFETANPRLDCYQGVVWYRRRFRLPRGWAGKRIVLHFQAANYVARVWLNDTFLGENRDGFLPFEFEAGDAISADDENALAVSVDSASHPGDVPGDQVQWRSFGGLTREVTLRATDPLYIDNVEIDASPTAGGAGETTVRIFLRNSRPAAAQARATATILDPQGKAVLTLDASQKVASGASAVLEAAGSIPAALLWSPDTPHLYTCAVSLADDSRSEIAAASLRFGFRRIQAAPDGLLLNGKPIFLLGFNRHEDSPATAMAVDRETTRQDLLRIKDTGANFIRLCHYPHHPYELDICDEIGLIVFDEIPLNLNVDAERAETAHRQIRRLIRRDRHHASVLFWSCGNETKEEEPLAAETNRSLIRLARQLDPSRLCVHVSFRWKDHPNFEADDVICINNYPSMHGWNGRRGSSPAVSPQEGAEKWRRQLTKLREKFPHKPILVTEFGYCSIGGTAGHALGEDRHEQVIRAEFPVLAPPLVCGACCWCWADHLWPPARVLDGMGMSPFGVNNRDRTPKKPLAATREMYLERRKTTAAR